MALTPALDLTNLCEAIRCQSNAVHTVPWTAAAATWGGGDNRSLLKRGGLLDRVRTSQLWVEDNKLALLELN